MISAQLQSPNKYKCALKTYILANEILVSKQCKQPQFVQEQLKEVLFYKEPKNPLNRKEKKSTDWSTVAHMLQNIYTYLDSKYTSPRSSHGFTEICKFHLKNTYLFISHCVNTLIYTVVFKIHFFLFINKHDASNIQPQNINR